MARILAISSQVARGTVGLSAIVPALHALGHDVIALPTILLSNHPGHAHVAGERIAPDVLLRMLDALEANGWLSGVDAMLTGYLPSVAHVSFAHDAVGRIRAKSASAIYLCDPVIGDEPNGIYVAEEAAIAIRDCLLPIADVVKLNRFELDWLTGKAWSESRLRREPSPLLGPDVVIATSMTGASDAQILNVAVTGDRGWSTCVERRTAVPKGTGDLFSGLLLGYKLIGHDWPAALGCATAALDLVIAASISRSELRITELTTAPVSGIASLPVTALTRQEGP